MLEDLESLLMVLNIVKIIYDLCDFTMNFLENGLHKKYWSFDENKFNDEKSWLDPNFTIASCHVCTYDTKTLREAIGESNIDKANRYLPMIRENMGAELFDRFMAISKEDRPKNLYKEWSIN